MSVRAVIPTRGLIYAQTLQSLKNNGIEDPVIISGLPIPDAHNACVREVMKSWISHILFLEDDMALPDGAVEQMLKINKPIVALDYPMDNGYSTLCRHNGEIIWCGLGATLISASVFRQMPDPWFETDHSYRLTENPFSLERIENPNKYGGHDINFCIKARKLGFTIAYLEGFEAQHLRAKVERTQENSGRYEITALPPVQYKQEY